MKVLFLGQLGIRASMGSPKTTREQRIETLGRALIAAGHQVTILGTRPHVDRNITNLHGMALRRKLSLNPQKPGGWLYLFSSLLTLWWHQPDVVHLHSWKAASLVWLAALISPETTFIWTIDAVPHKHWWAAKLVGRQAARVCDVITAPTRTLQYLLLHYFNVATNYIPDGYTPVKIKDIPLKEFGLRKGQYSVLLAQSDAVIRNNIRAYAASKNRKKLVILAEPTATWQRLLNKKSFVLFIGPKQGRQLHTLVRNAATVIAGEDWPYLDTLLLAMDSGRHIIAANTSLHQETLGLTAQYVRAGKVRDLQQLLQSFTGTVQKNWGLKAKKRARLFTWEQIIPEYLAAYRYHAIQYVPLDSARQLAHVPTRV